MSRFFCQPSRVNSAAESTTATASPIVNGFGTAAGSLGARNAASAVVAASPRRCKKRTKFRSTDMFRAKELRSIPSAARRAR